MMQVHLFNLALAALAIFIPTCLARRLSVSPIVDPARCALYFGTCNAFSEPATTADSLMALSLDTGKLVSP